MSRNRIGQQWGKYQLIQRLGQGGYAEVFLGQHERLPLQVAVKISLSSMADDAEQQFLQEARTVAMLQSPHIIRILDFDVQQNVPYIIMEYVPGGSLRTRYPKGSQLPLPLVVAYIKQAALALRYAHNHRFIHRDVKPENMLLNAGGQLVLGDFGIATLLPSTSFEQQNVAGTAPYMAPEQLQGKPCAASDQYALGIVTYEWLTGFCPFTGSSAEIAMQHMLTTPPPLRQYNPTVPTSVEQIVLTALNKDPSHRFLNVEAFALELEAALTPQMTPPFPGYSFAPSFGAPLAASVFPFASSENHRASAPTFQSSPSFSSPRYLAKEEKEPRSSFEENPDYASLCQQIGAKTRPFTGALVVQAPSYQEGTVVKLLDQGFWNLAPGLVECFPRTTYAEIRRHRVGDDHCVLAAVFTDLLPTQYAVWITHEKAVSAVVSQGEAKVISL